MSAETIIQTAILKALGTEHVSPSVEKGIIKVKRSGVFESPLGMFWRANSGALRGSSHALANPAGTADIIGCVGGRFVGIEVKQPGKDQTDVQRLWQAKVEAAGGLYAVVYSVREAVEVVGRWANGTV